MSLCTFLLSDNNTRCVRTAHHNITHTPRGTHPDLAARSPGATMDKNTFLQLFDIPGMLGERLFSVFDSKKTGACLM